MALNIEIKGSWCCSPLLQTRWPVFCWGELGHCTRPDQRLCISAGWRWWRGQLCPKTIVVLTSLLQGSTNNFAAPALAALVCEFFYTGPAALGPAFPEVFGHKIPKVTVCLAATVVTFLSYHCLHVWFLLSSCSWELQLMNTTWMGLSRIATLNTQATPRSSMVLLTCIKSSTPMQSTLPKWRHCELHGQLPSGMFQLFPTFHCSLSHPSAMTGKPSVVAYSDEFVPILDWFVSVVVLIVH